MSPRWSQDDYAAYLRKVSRGEFEQAVRDWSVGPAPREAESAGRIRVRITSFRRRSVDPDNLCPKYFIDCLRYAEIIRDDRPEDITLEVRQEKVARREQEGTLIEVIPTVGGGNQNPASAVSGTAHANL